tara:strand:+ start:135 stop:773 length:639 start_codon:yes stop_codon:yes gene_type:complete
MRHYFFFNPLKTAGKAICGHFNISNIHTLVKDVYHPNLKNFIKLQAIDITKYYYRMIFRKKTMLRIPAKKNKNIHVGTARNPYARSVSWFLDVKRNKFHQSYHNLNKDMNFKDFLMSNKNSAGLRTQKSYFIDWDDKYRLDYLIRYENINSDLKNFINSEKFYLEKFDYELKYKNQNPFKYNYKDYLCPTSIDIINKLQNEDFSFLGYNKLT